MRENVMEFDIDKLHLCSVRLSTFTNGRKLNFQPPLTPTQCLRAEKTSNAYTKVVRLFIRVTRPAHSLPPNRTHDA